MYCHKCGTQLPDDAAFCTKCGASVAALPAKQVAASAGPILAPLGVSSLNCPHCGAPISPKFGEMVINCEYCGTGVTLGNEGWTGIRKQTMIPIKYAEKDPILTEIHGLMDRGLLHRHLQENSTLEELNLSLIPYWLVSASAKTNVVASDMLVETGQIATTAALFGAMGGFGGRRGGIAGPLLAGAVLGSAMGANRGNARKGFEMGDNYTVPIVALKALIEYQPTNYEFNLAERTFFDVSKIPKDVKILNGDVGDEASIYQAKALVTQLQSDKAHAQYHMIQSIHTDVDVADVELLHAPTWFARYDHKGEKIVLLIDANSGGVINSIGL